MVILTATGAALVSLKIHFMSLNTSGIFFNMPLLTAAARWFVYG